MKLFYYANEFLKRSDWKDLALVKICLCSIGILIGLCVPKEKKRPVKYFALAGMLLTYIPLMEKFFRVISGGSKRAKEIQ